MMATDRPKSTEGLKPKILDEKAPGGDEVGNDVKKHNEDMEKRSDKAHEQIDGEEQVDSKFWSGEFSFVGLGRYALGVL